MALGGFKLDTNGLTLTVTVLTSSGATPTCYTTAAGTVTQSLPATVSSNTSFFFNGPEELTVSVKTAAGTEIASSTGTTIPFSVRDGQFTELAPRRAEPDYSDEASTVLANTYVPLSDTSVAHHRGVWATTTAYAVGDIVQVSTALANSYAPGLWRCLIAHTSGASFSGTSVSRWVELAGDLDSVTASGTYVKKWQPLTAYTAGDIVASPDGGEVLRLTSGTSGATFDPTSWGPVNFPLGLRQQTATIAPITISSVAMPGGASPGLVNLKHDDPTPSVDLYHITAGSNFAGNLIACGMDGGTGNGIFLNVKTTSKGMYVTTNDTITSAVAYGIYGVSGSSVAPLIRLESAGATMKPMLSMLSAGEARMAEFILAGAALAGFIDGTDGRLRWSKDITVEAGSPGIKLLGTINGQRGDLQPEGITGRAYSGSAGLHYPFRIISNPGSDGVTRVQTSAAVAVGSETWRNVMGWSTVSSAARFAFFGGTPIAQITRKGQLTDSSGGTSGGATIAAVTDFPSTANAIATLAAKVNALETVLSAAGGGYGLTT